MALSTAIAIYFLIWWLTLFAVLPWGVAAQGRSASVVRYELARPNAQATVLQARRLGEVFSAAGSQPVIIGGD